MEGGGGVTIHAWIRRTLVGIIASVPISYVARMTLAYVLTRSCVRALRMGVTILLPVPTQLHLCLTKFASPTSNTIAREFVLRIIAKGFILTWVTGTFVDIRSAPI
eukprot:SAG11_NODE_1727_length_4368_cov_60.807683_5_plen_106_part_00